MPRRVTDNRGLFDVSRTRLLGAVQEAPGSTLKALAEEVGLHVNTARGHLQVLIDEGFVRLETGTTGRRGRPPSLYHPVTAPQGSRQARERIEAAARQGRFLRSLHPDLSVEPAEVDELGDDAVAQFDALYAHLEDSGMEPESDAEDMGISVVPCPHYRMVGDDREDACAIHAQIVRDLLAQVPGPLELETLRPFAAERTCRITLRGSGCPGSAADPQ